MKLWSNLNPNPTFMGSLPSIDWDTLPQARVPPIKR